MLSDAVSSPITLGIFVGYVVGKPVGILVASSLASRRWMGGPKPPDGREPVQAGHVDVDDDRDRPRALHLREQLDSVGGLGHGEAVEAEEIGEDRADLRLVVGDDDDAWLRGRLHGKRSARTPKSSARPR